MALYLFERNLRYLVIFKYINKKLCTSSPSHMASVPLLYMKKCRHSLHGSAMHVTPSTPLHVLLKHSPVHTVGTAPFGQTTK